VIRIDLFPIAQAVLLAQGTEGGKEELPANMVHLAGDKHQDYLCTEPFASSTLLQPLSINTT